VFYYSLITKTSDNSLHNTLCNTYLTDNATRRDATWRDKSDVNGVGYQDSWRVTNRMYAQLRTTHNVNLNLKISWGFSEQIIYLASSSRTSAEFSSPNFPKQRNVWCFTGPKKFNQIINIIRTEQMTWKKINYLVRWYSQIPLNTGSY